MLHYYQKSVPITKHLKHKNYSY